MTSGSATIRVLIADDDAIDRLELAQGLEQESDMHVVAEAEDGQEAVEKALAWRPDVVILDLSMPRCNGFAAAQGLRAELPDVRIVGLSMHSGEYVAERMRAAGADAFVSKDAPLEELVAVIRRLHRHGPDLPERDTAS